MNAERGTTKHEPEPDDTDGDDVADAFDVDSVGAKRPSEDAPPTPTGDDAKRLSDDQ